MSLSVEGQKCPVCQAYLFPEDDLVFCPVCGLAHHRDCYKAIGHCAMEHLHGTEEQYKKPEKEENKPETKEPVSEEKSDKKCRFCGEEIPEDSRFCPNCRAPQSESFSGFAGPGMNINIPLDAEIDGVKVEEIARFTMLNPVRYIGKLMNLSKENRLSWNWAAFLFPAEWCFFRKNFKSGILLGLMQVAASLLSLPLNIALQDYVLADNIPRYQQMASIITENIDKIGYLPLILLLAGFAINMLIRVFWGANADYSYCQRMVNEIKAAQKLSDEERAEHYRKKGGINAFFFLLAYYATSFLPTLILNLAMVIF